MDIHGSCSTQFSAVREAFADSLRSGREVGASVAVYLDGEPVVDLWRLHAGCCVQDLNRPSKPCRALLQVSADPVLEGGRMPSMPTDRIPWGVGTYR